MVTLVPAVSAVLMADARIVELAEGVKFGGV